MSWLKTGMGALNQEAERREASYGAPEVWIKTGEYRDLVFIDNDPACCHRHTVWLNGEYQTYTCLADTGSSDIPCCEILGTKKNRNFTGNFTVVDVTPYKDKTGNDAKPSIRLFSAKYKTLQILRARQEDHGSLVGKMFRVRRTGDKSVSTGDDISLQREVDMAKLLSLATFKGKSFTDLVEKEAEKLAKVFDMPKGAETDKLVPFNYMQVLAPKTPTELRKYLRGYTPRDESDNSGGKSDTDVPF